MGASRIEHLIEDIYEFIESCKMQPLSSTKVVVPKDELYDLLDELRLRTPDEIKRYQKVLANRDAILADAEEKAVSIVAEAGMKANTLVNGHEIMQQAYEQANAMVNAAAEEANRVITNANEEAYQIRSAALSYTEGILSGAEHVLANAYESTKDKYGQMMESLKGNLDIIANNKKELSGQTGQVQTEHSMIDNQKEDSDEDYNFDVDTFLEDID